MQQLTSEERKKLIARLRGAWQWVRSDDYQLCLDAARGIEGQHQEIERLTAEVQKLKDELELVRRDEERFIYD